MTDDPIARIAEQLAAAFTTPAPARPFDHLGVDWHRLSSGQASDGEWVEARVLLQGLDAAAKARRKRARRATKACASIPAHRRGHARGAVEDALMAPWGLRRDERLIEAFANATDREQQRGLLTLATVGPWPWMEDDRPGRSSR